MWLFLQVGLPLLSVICFITLSFLSSPPIFSSYLISSSLYLSSIYLPFPLLLSSHVFLLYLYLLLCSLTLLISPFFSSPFPSVHLPSLYLLTLSFFFCILLNLQLHFLLVFISLFISPILYPSFPLLSLSLHFPLSIHYLAAYLIFSSPFLFGTLLNSIFLTLSFLLMSFLFHLPTSLLSPPLAFSLYFTFHSLSLPSFPSYHLLPSAFLSSCCLFSYPLFFLSSLIRRLELWLLPQHRLSMSRLQSEEINEVLLNLYSWGPQWRWAWFLGCLFVSLSISDYLLQPSVYQAFSICLW